MVNILSINSNKNFIYQDKKYNFKSAKLKNVQNLKEQVCVDKSKISSAIQLNIVNFKGKEYLKSKFLKKSLFDETNIGFGSLTFAGVGTVIYLAIKDLFETKKEQSLPENIEFKQAETCEEAILFGKTYLGIEKYKGFDAKDVDVLNWLNEGFVNVSNKVKGKLRFPKVIEYTKHTNDMLLAVDIFKNIMLVDKKTYGDIDQCLQNKLQELHIENAIDIVNLPKAECNTNDFRFLTDLIKKYYSCKGKDNSMSFKDKLKLYQNIDEYIDSITYYPYKPVSEFGTIYHDCWHLLDSKLMSRFGCTPVLEKNIAKKVSYYATTNETEYIAEVGRKYMEGIPLSDDVMALYKEYDGPVLV